MYKQINENLYWIGVLDRDLRVFDVIMETKYGTSYNSYLIKTTNHNILVETVKDRFLDEYLKNVNELVGIENIDYIIVNHTEPDHVGSLEKILKLNPNIEIIGSKAAITYLSDITNKEFKNKVVKPNEEMKIDNKTFKFFSVPFLHWPDSIYTYLVEDEALFTCDSFGSHYAFDGIFLSQLPNELKEDYEDALRYYYDAIFAPYKKFVLSAIEKIKDIPLSYLCTGHGPVIDTDPKHHIDTYKTWSLDKNPFNKLIVIPYATSYGYTEEMANKIIEGIKSVDDSYEIHTYNLNVLNYKELEQKVVSDIYYADALVIGSTTINKDATPVIWDLVTNLNAMLHSGKVGAVFGSYGWSGEGVDHIHDRMKSVGLKVMPYLKIKFKPSSDALNKLFEHGQDIAKFIQDKNHQVNLLNDQKIKMKD